jgi:hypothetical protein
LTISLYPRYRIRMLKFFDFCRTLASVSPRRVSQDIPNTYEEFIGSIFQPCDMASYIGAVKEQNAIKIFRLPNRKIPLCVFSLCAK